MRKLFVFLLIVWVAGAYISSLSPQGQKRSPRTMMEFSGNRIELFIRGLGWPLRIFGSDVGSQDVAPHSVAVVATEEQFSSALCALAEMPKNVQDNLRGAIRTYLQDRNEAKMVRAIEVDEVPFHLTRCFDKYASRTMSARASREDFRHFYDASERALLLTLMLDAMSKIAGDDQLKKIGNEARMEIQHRNEKYYL